MRLRMAARRLQRVATCALFAAVLVAIASPVLVACAILVLRGSRRARLVPATRSPRSRSRSQC
jgi:hypothetical protein